MLQLFHACLMNPLSFARKSVLPHEPLEGFSVDAGVVGRLLEIVVLGEQAQEVLALHGASRFPER